MAAQETSLCSPGIFLPQTHIFPRGTQPGSIILSTARVESWIRGQLSSSSPHPLWIHCHRQGSPGMWWIRRPCNRRSLFVREFLCESIRAWTFQRSMSDLKWRWHPQIQKERKWVWYVMWFSISTRSPGLCYLNVLSLCFYSLREQKLQVTEQRVYCITYKTISKISSPKLNQFWWSLPRMRSWCHGIAKRWK